MRYFDKTKYFMRNLCISLRAEKGPPRTGLDFKLSVTCMRQYRKWCREIMVCCTAEGGRNT
jgi:hypothetical protein